MWRILFFVNMAMSLVFLFAGEIDRATLHLVWCVLSQLGIDREERL